MADLALSLLVFVLFDSDNTAARFQLVDRFAWIDSELFSAAYFMGVDGLNAPLVLLTGLLGLCALLASWRIEFGDHGLPFNHPLHTLLFQKYYLDVLYEDLVVRRWFYRGLAGITDWLDRNLVDGFVDLIGGTFRNAGRAVAQLQTGQVQFYGTVVVLGAVLILLGYLILGAGG